MLSRFLALSLASLVTANFAIAEEPAKAPAGEKIEIESKLSEAKKCSACANTINFSKELSVPLAYLDTLGIRISEARKGPDPVELALAARALEVAEQVSDKKASVTSAEVMKEAVELAKMRGISTELAALTRIVDADLSKDLALATKREAQEKLDTEAGSEARDLHGTLQVANHSHEALRIYVSGRYVGVVYPHQTRNFHVHDHNHETVLDAYCLHGGELIRHTHVHGHRHFYHWHIH